MILMTEALTCVAFAVHSIRVGFAMVGAGNNMAVSAHAPAAPRLRQTLPRLETSVFPAGGPKTAPTSHGEAAG